MPNPEAWHDTWSQVDTTTDPGFFVRFLDSTRRQRLRAAYTNPARFFERLDIQAGHRILEVGCGTGELLHPLAALTGVDGRIVGVDQSLIMITEARKRAARDGACVEYLVGNAHHLDFPDNTFDRCFASAVFQHLEDPHKALGELVRVARPEAKIVIEETDWETQMVDAEDRALTRRILHFFCDSIRNGWIARRLPALFADAGLQNIRVDTFTSQANDHAEAGLAWISEMACRAQTAGVVSPDEVKRWLDDLEARTHRGRLFIASVGFRVSGRKG